MTSRDKTTRIDPEFSKWLNFLKTERIKKNVDKKTISDRELTRKIMNTNAKSLLQEELILNKRIDRIVRRKF